MSKLKDAEIERKMLHYLDGRHVELHPATDRWMMGDRFGAIVRLRKDGAAYIKLDRSGKKLWITAGNWNVKD